jgi:hypothetical protein
MDRRTRDRQQRRRRRVWQLVDAIQCGMDDRNPDWEALVKTARDLVSVLERLARDAAT